MNNRSPRPRKILLSIAIFPLFLTSCDRLTEKNPQEIELQAKQSIVSIASEYKSNSGEPRTINAAGFFVPTKENAPCTILTVGHIAPSGSKLQVQAGGKKWQIAPEDIKAVEGIDLALIKLSKSATKCPYPPLYLGDSDRISRGDISYIMGYIADKEGKNLSQKLDPVIAAGIVTNSLGYKMSYTPTAIIPGSPLLNKSGKVVGIHGSPEIARAISEDTELSQLSSYSSNAAIPINTAKAQIQEINVNPDFYLKIAIFAVGGTIAIAIAFWIARTVFFLVFPPACFWCGNALNWLQYDRAVVLYDLSLRFKPDRANVYHNRGRGLWTQKEYREAYESFYQAMKLNRKRYGDGALYQTLSASARSGNESLLKLYDIILKINHDDAIAFQQRGLALAKLQRYEEAVTSYDRAIELNPNDASSWRQRGYVLRQLNRYSDAVASYDRAIELNPDDNKTCLERGLAEGDSKTGRSAPRS
jgi:tetratricopeptide (TPR) repeat protein